MTTNYDREAEANTQAESIPINSKIAYIYGLALGDLPRELLLRECIAKLVVCSLNVDLFLHTLNVIDMTDWLSDERVVLVDATMIDDVYHPFAVSPAELNLANELSSRLRDRIVLELDDSFIKERHDIEHHWFVSAIEKNLPYIEKDPDILQLPWFNNQQVYIIGAGPTLNHHFKRLKENQLFERPIPLIATDAALKPLLNQGIIPDVVMSIDYSSYHLFEDVDFNVLKNTALVYFPRISVDIIEAWTGKRFCAYSNGNTYSDVNKKYPKTTLFSSGSVIHPAIDLAVKKGVQEIIFLGADFGFPDKKSHAEGQKIVGTDFYSSSVHWVLNGKNERITTLLNYRGYLRDLERYIETKPFVKFVNGSLEGAKITGTTLLE